MSKNKTEKKQTPKQVRIDDIDLEILSKIANEQDKSVSSLIRIAVKDYIKKYKAKTLKLKMMNVHFNN